MNGCRGKSGGAQSSAISKHCSNFEYSTIPLSHFLSSLTTHFKLNMPNDSASQRRTDANRRRLREALQSAFGSHINELKSSPTTEDPDYDDKLKEYRALSELMRTRGRSASPESHFIKQGQLDQDLRRMSAFPNSSATENKQKAHEERVIQNLSTCLFNDTTETAILNAMGNPSDRSSKVRLSRVWVDLGEPGFRNLEVPLYLLADAEQESGTVSLSIHQKGFSRA